jgi:hypothetical protein
MKIIMGFTEAFFPTGWLSSPHPERSDRLAEMFRQRQEDCSDREAGEDIQIAHEDHDGVH